MDQFDQAQALEELERERCIERIRCLKNEQHITHCLFCNEAISAGKFCCVECRDDYELESKLSHICGR